MLFDAIYKSGFLPAFGSWISIGTSVWVNGEDMQCCIVIVWVKAPDAIGKMLKLGPLGLTPVPNLYNLYLPHLNLHLPGLAVIHWY